MIGGCTVEESAPVATTQSEPSSLQLMRVRPELQDQRFSDLLNFEAPTDTVFVTTRDFQRERDDARAHAGHSSLRLQGHAGSMTVKLSSLITSKSFPSGWTEAGAYFLCDRPVQVSVACLSGKKVLATETTTLLPGQWSGAWVDLSHISPDLSPAADDLSLSFSMDVPNVIWCDDVMLIDNTRWVLGSPDKPSPGEWTLCRRGFNWICDAAGRFNLQLPSTESQAGGWQMDEANAMRMRFSSTGDVKSLTIYSDGRSYWDGKFRAMTADLRNDPLWARQESSPAEIQIPQAMGRLNRNAPGDSNNDGYCEARGSYSISATGSRVDVTILPRSIPVQHPVLEIAGLDAGKALVTIEGRLIEQTQRLSDGTLLVDLPIKVERAVTVNIRIQ